MFPIQLSSDGLPGTFLIKQGKTGSCLLGIVGQGTDSCPCAGSMALWPNQVIAWPVSLHCMPHMSSLGRILTP
jgi:hypothetical protein